MKKIKVERQRIWKCCRREERERERERERRNENWEREETGFEKFEGDEVKEIEGKKLKNKESTYLDLLDLLLDTGTILPKKKKREKRITVKSLNKGNGLP